MIGEIYLAGTINKDTVTNPDGLIFNSFGGLLYSLIPLAQLVPNTEIVPIVNLGRDCSEDVLGILRKYTNIKTDHIAIVEQENNHCHLTYTSQESKTEILSGGVPPLEYAALSAARGSGLFVMNFISGFDVTAETLIKFRSRYRGKIYMDLHSLTLGKHPDGRRYFRKPDNWRDYCTCADFLQMNAEEFKLVHGADLTIANQITLFSEFRERYLKALLVTCGSEGAYLTYEAGGQTECLHIPTQPAAQDADTTGCGDIFGAAFCAGLVIETDFERSVRLAVQTASLACKFKGVETLKFNPLN